jgi:hypothetical protein
MAPEASITLLTSLVSIGVVILLAGIPWAYTIHGRLSTIEASLKSGPRHGERLDSLLERLTRLEMRVDRGQEKAA